MASNSSSSSLVMMMIAIAMRRSSLLGLLPFLLLGFYFTLRQSYLFLNSAKEQTLMLRSQPKPALLQVIPTEDNESTTANRIKNVESNSTSETIAQPSPPSLKIMENNTTLKQQNAVDASGPFPKIVWLLSFPNSGTSFTMSLTERASNLSFASNYGDEVTARGLVSLPVHLDYPTGPYWEGVSSAASMGRAIRPLPDKFVLTKTHCGGRCVNCGPDRYVVKDAQHFLKACARTYARTTRGRPGAGPNNTTSLGRKVEFQMEYKHGRVAKVVHLIRHPIHNIVSRFHLDRKNRIRQEPELASYLHLNATGFRRWCTLIDYLYANPGGHHNVSGFHESWDNVTRTLFAQAPCRAEFFKYTQWHNRVLEMRRLLFDDSSQYDNIDIEDSSRFDDKVLTIHYEDYAENLTRPMMSILDFLEQERVHGIKLRPFKSKKTDEYYQDYFTRHEYASIRNLIQHVASPATWKRIQHYFGYTTVATNHAPETTRTKTSS